MRLGLLIGTSALALALAAFWLAGGFQWLEGWALAGQREAQGALAGALRALRAGNPGAWAAFLGVCFTYGFLHAAGPGHGKVLIGAYGAGRRIGLARLLGVALVSSLAQGAVAVALVLAAIGALGWTRDRLGLFADRDLATLGNVMILLLGLWLVTRGLRHLSELRRRTAHAHRHHHDETCPDCGHAHMPEPSRIAAARWPELVALVAAVAVRPCTGAIFVLILTWQMGIFAAGIAGAMAMALGTAATVAVAAILAVTLREGTVRGLASGRAAALALPMLELLAGALIAVVAAQILLRAV